ncbi:hypothetical protein ACLOJK_004871, partial [Asimina triloba]
AQVLKILEDQLPIELRAIREDATLGIESRLDIERRGPVELKLREKLLDIWRELRDLKERMH